MQDTRARRAFELAGLQKSQSDELAAKKVFAMATEIKTNQTSNDAEELRDYCRELANRARVGSRKLATVSGETKNAWLLAAADRLLAEENTILAANAIDLGRATEFGLTESQVDRLRLTPDRLAAMANGLRDVAALPDPVGEVIDGGVRPNGLQVSRVRVPIGVVFFIFESRPNVTVDAAAICLKSGNGVILRGGKEAAQTSTALIDVLIQTAKQLSLPTDALQWVTRPEREIVTHLLSMRGDIDVVIPRGGEGLIRHVSQHATMPVMKHESGNCHMYIDEAADIEMARRLVIDAKCQRPGVCNACESLLIHQAIADAFLPNMIRDLDQAGVEIRGDEAVARAGKATGIAITPIQPEDDSAEYLEKIISVRVVESLDAAMEHIESFSSHHTDAIVTNSVAAAQRFCQVVDSAAVLVNASTRFNDGGELGLGAEIGISTDRLHARGPCGLRELTTYKYVCWGSGQTKAPVNGDRS